MTSRRIRSVNSVNIPWRGWRSLLMAHSWPIYLVIGSILVALLIHHELVMRGSFIYWTDITAKAAGLIRIVAPVGAGFAAFEANRIRQQRELRQVSVRNSGMVLFSRLMPLWAVSLVLVALSVALSASAKGAPWGWPSWRVLLVYTLATLGYLCFGAIVGQLIHAVVAVPLAIVLVFVAIGFPPSFEPFWIRHLTGDVSDCCRTYQELATGAMLAPSIIGMALTVAALVVSQVRRKLVAVLVVVVLASGAVLLAKPLVSNLGWAPVQARASAVVCASATVEVCVWPEHRDRLAAVSKKADHMRQVMADRGIVVPSTASERIASGGSQWTFQLPDRATDESANAAVAMGLAPVPPAGCGNDDQGGSALGEASESLFAWLILVGGQNPMAFGFDPAIVKIAKNIAAQSPEAERAWYERQRALLLACPPR